MVKLSEHTESRDNNFNLIRFVAATLVLFTHSFSLSIGSSGAEPLRHSLGTTWGNIAVDVFFITSGFLITGSFFHRNNIIAFLWARILRIYPALIVAIIFCVFIVGLFFTTYTALEYFSSIQTYKFFLKNVTLIFNVEFNLPGVFENNPFKLLVNASLWTLPYEGSMYACLAIIASIILFFKNKLKYNMDYIFLVVVICGLGLNMLNHFQPDALDSRMHEFIRLFAMFFSGVAFYVYRSHIYLSSKLFVLLLITTLLSTFDKELFFIVYIISLPYMILYLSYVPSGFIRNFNKIGDYSYGMYIYAFPVQQSIASMVPNISIVTMILLSFCVTFVLAFCSWHFIEKKCLRLKNNYIFIEKTFQSFRPTHKSRE